MIINQRLNENLTPNPLLLPNKHKPAPASVDAVLAPVKVTETVPFAKTASKNAPPFIQVVIPAPVVDA